MHSNHVSFNNLKTATDLQLNQNERVGDILFLIGTIAALISTDQTEKALLEPPAQANKAAKESSQALKTLALSSWIFFMASIIFTVTAFARLRELNIEQSLPNSTPNTGNLFGQNVTTIGNVFKLIGFGLAAIGNQIRAGSTQ